MYFVEGRLGGVLAALLIAAAGVALSGAGPDFGTHSVASPAPAVGTPAATAAATPCSPVSRPPA